MLMIAYCLRKHSQGHRLTKAAYFYWLWLASFLSSTMADVGLVSIVFLLFTCLKLKIRVFGSS